MKIQEYEDLCKKLKQISGADGYVRCAHDGHAVSRLYDLSGLQLACVMPQIGFDGATDTYTRRATFIIYALLKNDDGQSMDDELTQYIRTEDAIHKIFIYLTEGENNQGCPPFPLINIKGITIDPEFNEFGGWNGYSITVSI